MYGKSGGRVEVELRIEFLFVFPIELFPLGTMLLLRSPLFVTADAQRGLSERYMPRLRSAWDRCPT